MHKAWASPVTILLHPLAQPHTIHTSHTAGVDMNPAALAVLRRRAAEAGLGNVQACNTMIEGFQQPFNIALAL